MSRGRRTGQAAVLDLISKGVRRATAYRWVKHGIPTIRRYSADEDELLRQMVGTGKTYVEMAMVLNRPKSSIQDRVKSVLRLPYRTTQTRIRRNWRSCTVCGSSFEIRTTSLRHHNRGLYCSQVCHGVANRNPDRRRVPTDRGTDWPSIRTRHLAVYKFCWRCGSQGRLHVHHIIPYRLRKDNREGNLAVLCASCHRHVEVATRNVIDIVPDLDIAAVLLRDALWKRWVPWNQ